MAVELIGKNGNKGLLERSGIVTTLGATIITLANQLVPLWIQDPKVQESVIILVTALVSALLVQWGNPSKKA